MTDSFDEDSVFRVHGRVQGAVLIIGVGTVGSSLAMQLARLGVSLRLIDKDILEPHNIVRHQLDATWRWQPKTKLADEIKRRMPWLRDDVDGIHANFTLLPHAERRRYIDEADVVVAATDEGDVQRFINRDCIEARKTVVFPGVWVDPDTQEAEAGEVLWVDPRLRMPCYQCVTIYREEAQDAQAGRGAQADIDSIVLATVLVVRGVLQPGSVYSEILHEHENLMLVHGFIPPSRQVGEIFAGRSLLHVEVPFPRERCPACGRQARPAPPRPAPAPARNAPTRAAPPETLPEWEGVDGPPRHYLRRILIGAAVVLIFVLGIFVPIGSHHHSEPQPRPSADAGFPPKHTKLICNPDIGGVVCQGTLHWASVLALSVQGLTQNVVDRLCAEGYKSKWSQNVDGYIMNPTMCQDPNAATLDQPNFTNGTMTVVFNPPTRKGRWVIVWRLYDHSGHLVRSSEYIAQVGSL